MKKSEKILLVRRLVARGEELCARVLCDDWSLDFDKVVGNENSKSK